MLRIVDVTKRFAANGVRTSELVLDQASFTVEQGQVVGFTGKSGAGKSTIARIICGMIPPDAGEVFYNDERLVSPKQAFPKHLRREIQMIPQQPMSALDPRQRIGDSICEPLLCHGIAKTKNEAKTMALHLLEHVWLEPEIAMRYPSQVSGGQAQRVVIARALGLTPRMLIADESTSMLDIPAQAQVISLLKKLVTESGISILLISHDKPLVKALADKVYHLNNAKLELETQS